MHGVIDAYVTPAHRDHPEAGCPSAALPVDASRHGAAPQAAYLVGLEGYFANITDLLLQRADEDGVELSPPAAREQAIAMFSQMVGALVISRAVAEPDTSLSNEILTANTRQLHRQ
ncbi:hypothetical protein [Curtobacterium sp. MCSS17_015]|uniref:hypothetical protein n=1 Tax=Curtobacterium sp. MCSS17_015 TaxID=2175666 RepID=UPI000DA8FF87|nr:hypothetical protein [Curtobacterium sp. MCSS17_015]WIB26848.1 hypothetical protein DEJ18_01780 [Curtobacterium sp. MCSS17_015]